MMNLRLIAVVFLVGLLGPVAFGWAAPPVSKGLLGDGRLSLFNYHRGEYLEVVYREKGRVVPEAVRRIEELLRSRGDGTSHSIDLGLLDLVDAIQDHFGAETVEVISGFRSPDYNRALKTAGRRVADASLHLKGQAMDIHLDEATEEDLFAFAKGLGAGGVGIYPRFGFVHVDVGPVRSWRGEPVRERMLVGTENNPNLAWSVVTDRDIYHRGETVVAAITNNGYEDQRLVMNVWLERFRKGQWSERQKLTPNPASERLDQGGSAEHRWEIPEDQPFGKYRLAVFASRDFSVPPALSNEFYIKRP